MGIREAFLKKCTKCGSLNIYRADNLVRTSIPPKYAYNCRDCGNHFFLTADDYDIGTPGLDNTPDLPSIETPRISMPPKIEVRRYGWECPKCGAVMAPNQPTCINCTGGNKIT